MRHPAMQAAFLPSASVCCFGLKATGNTSPFKKVSMRPVLLKSGDTPLELLALLLLALPLVLTLQKLLELSELGERSHQLAAV
jgi:hypothetical protein